MGEYDYLKSGDQKLVHKIINKNLIIYDTSLTKIGNQNCDCSAYEIKNIRDTFFCDDCYTLHQYKCSKFPELDTIFIDHYMTGDTQCKTCASAN